MAKKASYSLLVVDDQSDSVKPLCTYLRKMGHDVAYAADSEQARACIETSFPDLILLDLVLGDASGFDVLQQWRADVRLADVPVLFLSGHEDTDRKVEGFTRGAVDYITKGTDLREIAARIDLHLRLRDHERALAQKCQELQAAREEIDRAEKMALVGRLAAEIASDLAEPLSFMISGLRMMHDDLHELTTAMASCRALRVDAKSPQADVGDGEPFCTEARRNAVRDMEDISSECAEGAEVIARLTSNLREFAHGGEGTITAMDLNRLTDEAMVRAMEVQPQARIVRDYGRLDPLRGNPERIRHLLFLLASNALRTGGPAMTLTVSTRQDGNSVRVEMIVQGSAGVTAAPGRFSRAGSGLEWDFAQHIAAAHGGSVKVTHNDEDTLQISAVLPRAPAIN